MSAYPAYASPAPAPFDDNARYINRTPSPTPSEVAALNQKTLIDIQGLFQKDKMLSKKYLIAYVVVIVVIILTALLLIYDKQIVHFIQPAANWMYKLPAGWLIPIAIFFVISFPPLFGHEILAAVCGLVWGVWIGFGITAAGTVLGEIGNFYAFRYVFHARAEKMEKNNIQYACLSKLVREGGFRIALIARYSALPGHFTTAIFSVCGMNIFVFIAAAALSMPKQFTLVYIGTLLESDANGTETTQNKIISYTVTFVTILVTVAAMWYLRTQINKVKPDIIYARRKARQAKLQNSDVLYQNSGLTGSTDDTVFNANTSDVNLLSRSDAPYDSPYQQWDRDGRAVGYAEDPQVLAPQPRRANASFNTNFGAPSRTGNVATSNQTRQGTTDTAAWALQMNAADGQAFPLRSVPESGPPEQPMQNPFDNGSSETITPPAGPPPARSSTGDYAFRSPQHSFQGSSGGQAARTFSPPPPSYRV